LSNYAHLLIKLILWYINLLELIKVLVEMVGACTSVSASLHGLAKIAVKASTLPVQIQLAIKFDSYSTLLSSIHSAFFCKKKLAVLNTICRY